ncbi:MAG: PaaI family thioesterase [Acidimicrobiales bacterium]|jgi:acyl-coenzyme A thioesterase PaaI-like protein|nr:PaaI family thioesterase [Acidimicrobiales bacterium]
MSTPPPRPPSTAALAAALGDALPPADEVRAEELDLVARTRALVEAVVLTDVAPEVRAEVAERIAEATAMLSTRRRAEPLYLVRHDDGRLESLLQAGSGRLNPQAPPLVWIDRPTEPPAGAEPVPATVRARCTYTAAHAGSPGRVHGGVLALTLDEVLGNAVTASGASGLTVALSVRFRGPTPVDRPVDIVARFAGRDGRKSRATGEVVVDGVTTVEADALFVAVATPTLDGEAAS